MEKKHATEMASSYQSTFRLRPAIERNFTFPARSSGHPLTLSVNPSSNPPLTIFFNGEVGIFHLPADQAERIMKMAERAGSGKGLLANGCSSQVELLAKLREDLPIAKKRSLQLFLEKRKERITTSMLNLGQGIQ